jgi:hypothetical protein
MTEIDTSRKVKPAVVIHSCNPSYLGSGGRRMSSLRPTWTIKLARSYLKKKMKLGAVAHTCNSSYLGSRDQEDHSSKPACANKLARP